MKRFQWFACVILIIFAGACKKNSDSTTPANPVTSLVKTITYTDTTGTYLASMSLQYDGQGRVMQMIFDNPPDMDSLIHKFEYYPSMVVEKIFSRNNARWGRTVYSLNAGGLATSETDIGYSQNGDSSVAETVKYTYNTDGYMMEKKSFLYGDTATWISYGWQVMNGNNTSMSLALSIWEGLSVIESYTYYPNSVNSLGNSNTGKAFLGKSNANLIKSSVTNNTIPKSGTYSYTFDSMNRVSHEFIRGDGLATSDVNLAFTYY